MSDNEATKKKRAAVAAESQKEPSKAEKPAKEK